MKRNGQNETNESKVGSVDVETELELLYEKRDNLSAEVDKKNCFIAISSGLISALLDSFVFKDFNIIEGREISDNIVNSFVLKIAHRCNYKGEDIREAVAYLENKNNIPSDGNTSDFGGGLQHHLRDFAHHPTIVGLFFSLLTQYTGKSYGTDKNGNFVSFQIPEKSKKYIGGSHKEKIFRGTVRWFFHLVSDIAGSHETAGSSGGVGIPGPILSLAKELSTLPLINKISVNDQTLSLLISKLYNGTFLAEHDEKGKIIKGTEVRIDLRGEMGAFLEINKQGLPCLVNEIIVTSFYSVRLFVRRIIEGRIESWEDIWCKKDDQILQKEEAVLSRMRFISCCVFTSIDFSAAIITGNVFANINWIGISLLLGSIKEEIDSNLKIRNTNKCIGYYKRIQRYTYDSYYYSFLNVFALSNEQLEIMYNLYYYKTLYDCERTSSKNLHTKKTEWLKEWKKYSEKAYVKFTNHESKGLQWYVKDDLLRLIDNNKPDDIWFRIVLLEVMLFKPYYSLEIRCNGEVRKIDKTYKWIYTSDAFGDSFLDDFFPEKYYQKGYIPTLRKTYKKITRKLNGFYKKLIAGVIVTATVIVVIESDKFDSIKDSVIENLMPYSCQQLSNVLTPYVLEGSKILIGGGAIFGVGYCAHRGLKNVLCCSSEPGEIILESTKLIVTLEEIILNDKKDIDLADIIIQKYEDEINRIDNKQKKNEDDKKTLKIMNGAIQYMKKKRDSFSIAGID